jgi:histidine triad (HIT) family protein
MVAAGESSSDPCVFCEIVSGRSPASLVYADTLTLAFIDLRQFHPGHTLVIPRAHLADVRELDAATGAALMATVSRITRAVSQAFPNQGLSLWHSIGPAAFQEVPHLHIHVHPRLPEDGFLRVYPQDPATPNALIREDYAQRIRAVL